MLQQIRCEQKERVETGAVQFIYNDEYRDWSGYFLRGDNFAAMCLCIQEVKKWISKQTEEQKKDFPTLFWMQIEDLLNNSDVIK